MKFIRYIFYAFFLLCLLLIPIYSAGRLVLPNYIKKEIMNNLPKGSTLAIGSIHTKADLQIIFENIKFKSNNDNFTFFSPKIEISPRFSISKPVEIIIKELELRGNQFSSKLKDLQANVIFDHTKSKQLSIAGAINEIENSHSLVFSQLEFLLEGLESNNKNVNFKVNQINFEYTNKYGPFKLSGKNLNGKGVFNDNPSIILNIEDLDLDMSKTISDNENRIISSSFAKLELGFIKGKHLSLPLQFYLNNSKTPIAELSEKISILTSIHWSDANPNCTYFDLLSYNINCGVPKDFLNTSISIEDGKGGLVSIAGKGICVTPLANCPQQIDAIVRSRKTTQIFSQIMISGIINPILGGILLSGLLTTPDDGDEKYDHKVNIDVIGSKILLNKKPLI